MVELVVIGPYLVSHGRRVAAECNIPYPFNNILIYPIVQFVAFWNGKDSLGRTLV